MRFLLCHLDLLSTASLSWCKTALPMNTSENSLEFLFVISTEHQCTLPRINSVPDFDAIVKLIMVLHHQQSCRQLFPGISILYNVPVCQKDLVSTCCFAFILLLAILVYWALFHWGTELWHHWKHLCELPSLLKILASNLLTLSLCLSERWADRYHHALFKVPPFLLFGFWHWVSLCSLVYPGTYHWPMAHRVSLFSASQVVGCKTCATMPGIFVKLSIGVM